jgi:hypothetical protein
MSEWTTTVESGVSLRDYFAAAALTGLLASGDKDACCTKAYQFADGMMMVREELEKNSS